MSQHTVGIIAEFDPFHRGHAYLIEQVKARFPDSPIVVAMSGHFTQRGGAAALSPHARAEMALSCGADLVLELPLPWAISSAEGFARGGIATLAGVADTLVCGSECGREELLQKAADCLGTEAYRAELKRQLSSGVSFASARQRAVAALAGKEIAAVLAQPNDLLAVSYLEAIAHFGLNMTVKTVRRTGPAHNADGTENGFASASVIRRLLLSGQITEATQLIPKPAQRILRRACKAGEAPADLRRCERAMLYRLRQMTPADFAALPDCSEGLENRLYRAAQQAVSLEQFYELAKSKRYPHARIRRLALWAFLGLTEQDRPGVPPYYRVLGMSSRGQHPLHDLVRCCPVPVITKPASAKGLTGEAGRLFAL
ncbi:MAG: nucleotidyltransferase family protein, partial [Oscillospiraceae bacterium]|nr:nucleotidyltransferase family protein [Oscillospiraceae bacterium]